MVKIHDGFVNADMALLALSHCLVYFAMQDYLIGSYVKRSSSSFDLSVHYRGDNVPMMPWGSIQPSSYEITYYDDVEEPFKVMRLFFEVAKQEGDEL